MSTYTHPTISIQESDGYKKYKNIENDMKDAFEKKRSNLTGLKRFRFINDHIDKSDPNWTHKNMIEVYDITVIKDKCVVSFFGHRSSTAIGFDSKLSKHTRLDSFENPFICEENAILEILRPYILLDKTQNPRDIIRFKDIYDKILSYDEENDAYRVKNVEDIINSESVKSDDAYRHLDQSTYNKLKSLYWGTECGYVPIKTDKEDTFAASMWV